MDNEFNFDEIRPYTDAEVHPAFERVCKEAEFRNVLKLIFPNNSVEELVEKLLHVETVEEFQTKVMIAYLKSVIKLYAEGLDYQGLDRLDKNRKHLFISNHRDIVLDAALLNMIFVDNGMPTNENAIGDNLCKREWIAEVMKLNKNFLVKRSGTKREIFESSRRLSAYIRDRIKNNANSVWIAQREGRAKDSNDRMQESLLKMLTMSADSFKQGFEELDIVPVSISYEYDACDYLKAKEFQLKRDNPDYKKSEGEDVHNMRVGLTGYKGHIHYEIMGSISDQISKEVDESDDRATTIEKVAKIIDTSIHKGYQIYASNYVAYDERFGTDRFADMYSSIEKNLFDEYISGQIEKIKIDNRDDAFLREKLLEMYSNPLINQLEANSND